MTDKATFFRPRGDLRASSSAVGCFLAMGAVWGAIAAVMPDLRTAIGASDSVLGVILFITAAVSALAMLLAPVFGRALGAAALPLAAAAMVLSLVVPGQLTDVQVFAVALALVGGTSGLVEILMNARVAAIEAATGRPLMNLNHAAYSLSFFATAVLTGLARDAGVSAGLILTVVAAAMTPAVMMTVSAPAAVTSPTPASGADSPRAAGAIRGGWSSVTLLGGLVILVASLAEAGTETWSALHLERTLGASPAWGGAGPAVLGLSMGVGRLAGQALTRRVADATLMQAGGALAALGAAATAIAPGPPVAFAGIALIGLGASVIVPIALTMVSRGVGATARTTAISRASFLGFVGYIAGPALMGLVSDMVSLRLSFLLLGAALLALPVIVPWLARHTGP